MVGAASNFFPSALNSFSCSLIHGSINQEIITYQALQLVRVPTNVCKIKDDNTESYRNISYLLLLSSVSLMELHLYPENHQSVFFSQNREVFRVYSLLMNPATSVNWKNRLEKYTILCQLHSTSTQRTQRGGITDILMIYVKLDRGVMGTKFKNNPRSMARTKKRLKIIIMEHSDSLSYLILSWLNPLLEVL